MIRSFHYAAYATEVEIPDRLLLEKWATYWTTAVSAAYLDAYFQTAGSTPSVPQSDKERKSLLDTFLLQKALYEVTYELNNRPDWVSIPLRGVLSLFD